MTTPKRPDALQVGRNRPTKLRPVWVIGLLFWIAMGVYWASPLAGVPAAQPPAAEFIAHTIDTGLSGGYQVVVADLNRDGKPDIIALAGGLKEVRWYENPGWAIQRRPGR